jgi:hypothetical protein
MPASPGSAGGVVVEQPAESQHSQSASVHAHSPSTQGTIHSRMSQTPTIATSVLSDAMYCHPTHIDEPAIAASWPVLVR